MTSIRFAELSAEFNVALGHLSAARMAYEDAPRDPALIQALGAARIRLDDARSAIDVERRKMAVRTPWRVVPAAIDAVRPPPLWAIDHGPNA